MRIDFKSFLKGAVIGALLLLVANYASSSYKYDIVAEGSSECDQAENCNVIKNPEQSGNYTNDEEISYAVIKAGTSLINVNPGSDQTINGCYSVSLTGTSFSWSKLVDISDCQDISHIQIWSQVQENNYQEEIKNNNESNDTSNEEVGSVKNDLNSSVLAEFTEVPPTFPNCAAQTQPGDIAHYDYGWHQIVGQSGLVEGEDDVYSLPDGNYLQCFCPVEGDNGTQTVWWNIGDTVLDQVLDFISLGWIFENGAQWNLTTDNYLARNTTYYCGEVTPTPTTTVTPTPTPSDEPESRCSGLSASPTSGTAPLTVRFNGSGFDEDGEIQKYRFDFGDASGGQPQIWTQDDSEASHRYEFAGTYFAALHIQDSRGNWRNGENDCKVEITVKAKPDVMGGSDVQTLPETGSPIALASTLLSVGALGAYAFKRFKLL